MQHIKHLVIAAALCLPQIIWPAAAQAPVIRRKVNDGVFRSRFGQLNANCKDAKMHVHLKANPTLADYKEFSIKALLCGSLEWFKKNIIYTTQGFDKDGNFTEVFYHASSPKTKIEKGYALVKNKESLWASMRPSGDTYETVVYDVKTPIPVNQFSRSKALADIVLKQDNPDALRNVFTRTMALSQKISDGRLASDLKNHRAGLKYLRDHVLAVDFNHGVV